MKHLIPYLLTLMCTVVLQAQDNTEASIENILKYRNLANSTEAIDKSFEYARKAIKLSNKLGLDSTKLASNKVLSGLFLVNGQYDSLYRINKENIKLATKLKDTLKIAYASENVAYHFLDSKVLDSSYYYYYNAQKYYRLKGKKQLVVGALLNMSNIQETERDFIGAEINAVEGLKILKDLPLNEDVLLSYWAFNNLIAIVSSQIDRFDKAIEYHNKALYYSDKMQDKDYALYSKTNIGMVYRRKGEYAKAIKLFEEILKDKNLKTNDPSSYITAKSELTYNRFLNGSTKIKDIELALKESYVIAVEEEDMAETISISEFLADFYLKQKQNDSAFKYAQIAYEKSKQTNANISLLNALILKSKIKGGEPAKKYLLEHIALNDSLVLKERAIRNKFARIAFETEEIKEENREISKQRLWFMAISIALLLTLILLYIIKNQREKNKELQFVQQQQKSNEEIYNLMLSQQDKIEEGRVQEKRRISEELHDGILGRLFGTRLSLDSLNFITTAEAAETRGDYIEELKKIEEDIRKVSHDLNTDFVSGSSYVDIVKTLIDTQSKAYKFKYKFKHDDAIHWEDVANKTKIHIYRIIQESLQNIYKHAQATQVIISFKLKNNVICLLLADNGIGYDTDKSKKGIGLKNINSRVKEINGTLVIKSVKNKGTVINIEVPTQQQN
ncbi:ATP-binding protein [Lacinutrix salivirga]